MEVHRNAAGRLPRKPRRQVEAALTVQVDADAYARALELAGGDPSRLKIISATQIQIMNRGK